MFIKSDFKKKIFLKLTLNGQSDMAFLLTSTFCPLGLSTPAPGLYTCGKTLKNMYKIRVERDFLYLATNGKVIRPFCWHQAFDPKGFSAPVLGLYT